VDDDDDLQHADLAVLGVPSDQESQLEDDESRVSASTAFAVTASSAAAVAFAFVVLVFWLT